MTPSGRTADKIFVQEPTPVLGCEPCRTADAAAR